MPKPFRVSLVLLSLAAVANAASAQTTGTPAPAAGDTVSVEQLSITLDPKALSSAEAEKKVAAFKAATQGLRSCADVPKAAATVGATVVSNPGLPLLSVPERLRALLATMPLGTATPLFGSREEGVVRSLVLCGRGRAQQRAA